MANELTARQIYERAAREAEKAVEVEAVPEEEAKLSDFEEFDIEYDVTLPPKQSCHVSVMTETKQPRETAADRRNFYRKQAGWPQLRVK